MIPMRDGVKLHAVIVVPKGATHAPILLTRTPYNASKRAERSRSTRMAATLPVSDERSPPTAATSACSRTCAASTARKAST